jgi:prepilin peptidase CpaA
MASMSLLPVVFALGLLGAAAGWDIAVRRIPDLTSLGLLLLGIAERASEGVADLGVSVACAALVFVLLTLLHARGLLGGGDVKLAAALAIGLPPLGIYQLVMLTGALGGLLALLYLLLAQILPAPRPAGPAATLLKRIRAAEAWRIRRRGPLPYGVAIAGAGAFLLLRSHGG